MQEFDTENISVDVYGIGNLKIVSSRAAQTFQHRHKFVVYKQSSRRL